MTDIEYEVLDELYFVIGYRELIDAVQLKEEDVISALKELVEKSWVRCYRNESEELTQDELDLQNNYSKYHYLASKAGLFAHNSI